MLYLDDKPWEKKEWEAILKKYLSPKNKKKEFIFTLVDRYYGTKKVDGKQVPTCPPSLNYPMSYQFLLNGEYKTLRYAERPSIPKANKQGSPTLIHDADKIIFDNGVLRVDRKQEDLYLFLMLSPNNYTNPSYYKHDTSGKLVKNEAEWPRTANFIFREKNEELEAADTYDIAKAKNEAESYIFNMMTDAEARELYVLYNLGNKVEADEMPLKKIKNLLLSIAREKPQEFMNDLNSKVRTLKGKVLEARNADIIHFDTKKGWWMWSGDKNGRIIQVAKGKDEYAELVRFLNEKDDGSVLEALEGKIIAAEKEVEA